MGRKESNQTNKQTNKQMNNKKIEITASNFQEILLRDSMLHEHNHTVPFVISWPKSICYMNIFFGNVVGFESYSWSSVGYEEFV